MNYSQTKSLQLSLALALSFVRGIGLSFTLGHSTLDTIVDLVFAGIYLSFCKNWFIADALEHGIVFPDDGARSRFGRRAFIFPLYFRSRGRDVWKGNLLALGFLFLTFLVIVCGGFIGLLLFSPNS